MVATDAKDVDDVDEDGLRALHAADKRIMVKKMDVTDAEEVDKVVTSVICMVVALDQDDAVAQVIRQWRMTGMHFQTSPAHVAHVERINARLDIVINNASYMDNVSNQLATVSVWQCDNCLIWAAHCDETEPSDSCWGFHVELFRQDPWFIAARLLTVATLVNAGSHGSHAEVKHPPPVRGKLQTARVDDQQASLQS